MIKLKIKYGNSQTDLRFPCTEKEMNAALERIHAEDVTPLELYVSEVIFPEELGFLQDRFANLDEGNYLAKRMDSFFGDEEYQFYEAMKLEGFDTLPDLINLSFNLNRYPLIRDIGDMGKIGREYLLTVNGCVPADDADDPKYAELGRELIQSGNGIFTEHGMLFVDENTPFQRSYDGQTFPPYLYDPGVLCVAKAEYGGKTEYLYFPCEEEAIDKAFARLGTTADEVKITLEDFNTDSPEWFGRFREIASEEGVYELNRLTDNKDEDIAVKLFSESDFGRHLLLTLNEKNSIADANMLTLVIGAASEDIKEELEQNILYDQYDSMDEVINAVRQMTQDAGPVKAVFFCPLIGNIDEGDGDMFTVGDSYLADSADEIADALNRYTANDENDMAAYYNKDDGVSEKLTSAVWSVELHGDRLFGRIDCGLKEALTAEETEALRDWLSGQCSDGLGEGFEQQPIDTMDGELFVSFWNSGDVYAMMTESEFDEYLQQNEMQMGGM